MLTANQATEIVKSTIDQTTEMTHSLLREQFKNLNLQQCGEAWKDALAHNVSWAISYNYSGPVWGLRPGQLAPPLITYKGCVDLCGSSYQLYSWATISDAITTWILPLAGGLLLQAPFESNHWLSTTLSIFRWLGSPIACLMITFWNIKITGRCALLVDMCVSRENTGDSFKRSYKRFWKDSWQLLKTNFNLDPPPLEPLNPQHSQDTLSQFRDSLYILSVLNQFAFNERVFDPNNTQSIKSFLQYALFCTSGSVNITIRSRSDSQIIYSQHSRNASIQQPAELSNLLSPRSIDPAPDREASTSSSETYVEPITMVVPLTERREQLADTLRKARKHGVVQVLVSMLWFLVALGVSINKAFGDLGNNTTGHNLAMGLYMSWLPVLISTSLVDRNPTNSEVVQRLLEDFFQEVSSGRTPSIQDEDTGTAQISGIGYHSNTQRLLPTHYLKFFNGQGRKAWHYGIAHTILTHIEHNILTTTENKRSDSAGGSLPLRERQILRLYKDGSMASDTAQMEQGLWRFDMIEMWQGLLAFAVVACSACGAFSLSYHEPTVGLGCRSRGVAIFASLAGVAFLLELLGWFLERPGDTSPRRHNSRIFLRVFITVIEITNTSWLVYTLVSQSFGLYNNCACKSSVAGFRGGYADFEIGATVYLERYDVKTWWIVGTVLGMLPLLTLVGVVYQWCTQAFIWAEDFDAAMRGLRRVRWWKSWFHWGWLNHLFIKWPEYLVTRTFGGTVFRTIEWSR